MAQNQVIVSCPEGVYTQLTNADATALTFQVQRGHVRVRFTAGATQPAASAAGYIFSASDGEVMSALSDLTALSGATRVWAQGIGATAEVFVDHA